MAVNENGLTDKKDFEFDFEMPELDGFDMNFANFSDIEIDLPDSFQSRYIKPPKTKLKGDKHCKYERAEDLAKDISIEKGSRVFAIINGTFIFGDLFEALAVKHNWKIRRMVISTLSMSMNNIDSLANLLNWEYCERLDLIVSDHWYSHERGMLVESLYEKLDIGNKFQLAAARTHCKTVNIETECGLFITIHGSANLRSSGNIEQICIEENEDLHNFNVAYQDSILERFSTIDKSLSKKKTWQAVVAPPETAEVNA